MTLWHLELLILAQSMFRSDLNEQLQKNNKLSTSTRAEILSHC